MTDFNFNVNELPESENNYELLPEGWYPVLVSKAETKDTSTGGKMIKLELTIQGANYAGRKLFTNINIRNSNPEAERIGLEAVRKVMVATGLAQFNNVNQLLNKQLQVKTKHGKERVVDGRTYEAQNEVRDYKALNGSTLPMANTPAQATPNNAPAAPPWAKQ